MKTSHTILSAASLIPLLSSCASYQKTADSQAWSIKPLYSVRHATETPESFYQLGRYYQGQNRYEQALTAYQKALAIDGAYAEARNGMGVIYALQGRQQEAIEQLRLAVKQAPNAAHIQNNLGYALYLGGAYTEAVGALKQAVALEPANQSAHTNLALALDKAGDREQAVQVMAQATGSQPVENAPPIVQETQRAQTQTATPTPAPAVATAATPPAAPPQALALPKDWGVIAPAPRPVASAAGSRQLVEVALRAHELRMETEVHALATPAATPLRQASLQLKEPGKVIQAPKPVAAEVRAQPSPQAAVKAPEQQAHASVSTEKPYRIEISNGNGVTGMAKKVANFLGKDGYSNARLTNEKPFQVAASQVQYRAGYREQAQTLTLTLPGQPGITQSDSLRGDISVRVVLGKDVASKVAYFEQGQSKLHLARY